MINKIFVASLLCGFFFCNSMISVVNANFVISGENVDKVTGVHYSVADELVGAAKDKAKEKVNEKKEEAKKRVKDSVNKKINKVLNF